MGKGPSANKQLRAMCSTTASIGSKNILRCFILLQLFFVASCTTSRQSDFNKAITAARTQMSKQKFQDALASVNEAIHLMPDSSVSYLLRGQIYFGLNKYDLSRRDLSVVEKEDPKNTVCLFYTAMDYLATQKYDTSIVYFNKAFDSKVVGGVYVETDTRTEVGKNFTNNIPIGMVYYNRGIAYYNKYLYSNSISDFTSAIDEHFAVGASYLYLGMIKQELGDQTACCRYLHLAVDNGSIEAKKYLAENCN